MAGQVGVLPVPVILAAVDGDESSLAAVTAHFRRYIRGLSTRVLNDEYGNTYLYVDQVRQDFLQERAINAVVIRQEGHQFLKLILSPEAACPQQLLHQTEHRGDVPHLIAVHFLRGKEFRKHQHHRYTI